MGTHKTARYHGALLHAAIIAAVAITIGAGCTSGPPRISVEGAYAELSPMILGSCSVFLAIRNSGGSDRLIGASAELPRAIVELHDVRDHRMVRVDAIPVPGRETTALRPGSHHIMIFNLPRSAKRGTSIALSLRFEKSGVRQVRVRIE